MTRLLFDIEANGLLKTVSKIHCHKTGVVRKLLCPQCNTALGQARDNPGTLRRMAAYLEEQHEATL